MICKCQNKPDAVEKSETRNGEFAMIYRNTIKQINTSFENGVFSLEQWKHYMDNILPDSKVLMLDDIKNYDFEKDILPIINNVFTDQKRLSNLSHLTDELIEQANKSIQNVFGKDIDCEVILYLGLCNGAGWVIELGEKTLVLLGIEKILELDWDNRNQMIGLIYHELGHVYQKQYGVLQRKFSNTSDSFMWQLYTEGVAMYFEQCVIGDHSFYHQNINGWKPYFDSHLKNLKEDFKTDILTTTRDKQRYFGDWVSYNSYTDAGYYLGCRFIQYICETRSFNDIIGLSIDEVKKMYTEFCNV
jgi:hypothetical protein